MNTYKHQSSGHRPTLLRALHTALFDIEIPVLPLVAAGHRLIREDIQPATVAKERLLQLLSFSTSQTFAAFLHTCSIKYMFIISLYLTFLYLFQDKNTRFAFVIQMAISEAFNINSARRSFCTETTF